VAAVEFSFDQRGFSFKKMSKISQTDITVKLFQRRQEFVGIQRSLGREDGRVEVVDTKPL